MILLCGKQYEVGRREMKRKVRNQAWKEVEGPRNSSLSQEAGIHKSLCLKVGPSLCSSARPSQILALTLIYWVTLGIS